MRGDFSMGIKNFIFNNIEKVFIFANKYNKSDEILMLLSREQIERNILKNEIKSLKDVEFKAYSQFGEDGIIFWLINRIPIKNRTFVEFGVEDYTEANTRLLLQLENWNGFIIDGNKKNIDAIKKNISFYWKYSINAVNEFITKENINSLLHKSGFDYDLGLLSIDIDGNDYWILDAIEMYKPRILICEYNAIFGNKEKVTVPYKEDFVKNKEHFSSLYFGASLPAIIFAAKKKGYSFVGTCSNGVNAFFIRNDLIEYIPKNLINTPIIYECKFRSALDRNGKLLFKGIEAKNLIDELYVFDIENSTMKMIKEIKY